MDHLTLSKIPYTFCMCRVNYVAQNKISYFSVLYLLIYLLLVLVCFGTIRYDMDSKTVFFMYINRVKMCLAIWLTKVLRESNVL